MSTAARAWTGGAARAPDGWERSVIGWDAAFYALTVLTAFHLVTGGDATGWRLLVGLGAIGTLLVSYALLGATAARDRSQPKAVTYLVVLGTAIPLLLWLDGGFSFLLFIAYPQVWMLLDGRGRAVAATVAMSLAAGGGLLLAFGTDPATLRSVGVSMAVSSAFSLILGLWVTSIIEQSADRGELLIQLEAAREGLAAAERATGAAAERERLAADIHDTLAQGFTSVVMLTQVARRELQQSADPAMVAERLDAIEDVARTNLAEARALVATASPVQVHGSDLVAALRRLGSRFGAETGVRVVVEADPGIQQHLTPATAVVLLRSAQEGLANVRKHAGAHRVEVRLVRRRTGPVELTVHDDGTGFDPSAPSAGYGLVGLRRRVHDVGGSSDVSSGPTTGTRLLVAVPAR